MTRRRHGWWRAVCFGPLAFVALAGGQVAAAQDATTSLRGVVYVDSNANGQRDEG